MAYYPNENHGGGGLGQAIALWDQFFGPGSKLRQAQLADAQNTNTLFPLRQTAMQLANATAENTNRTTKVAADSAEQGFGDQQNFRKDYPGALPLFEPQPTTLSLFSDALPKQTEPPALDRSEFVPWAKLTPEARGAFKGKFGDVHPSQLPDAYAKFMGSETGQAAPRPGLRAVGLSSGPNGDQTSYLPELPVGLFHPPQDPAEAQKVDDSAPLEKWPKSFSQPVLVPKIVNGVQSFDYGQAPLTDTETRLLHRFPDAVQSHFPQERQEMAKQHADAYKKTVESFQTEAGKNDAVSGYVGGGGRVGIHQFYNDAKAIMTKHVDKAGNPTGDLSPNEAFAMIFKAGKIEDPNAVIRQQEFDNIAHQAGMLDRWKQFYAKVVDGKSVPPALALDIWNVIQTTEASRRNQFFNALNGIGKFAAMQDVPLQKLVPDETILKEFEDWKTKGPQAGPPGGNNGGAASPAGAAPNGATVMPPSANLPKGAISFATEEQYQAALRAGTLPPDTAVYVDTGTGLQRRHNLLVPPSPSPVLDEGTKRGIGNTMQGSFPNLPFLLPHF